MATIEEDDAGYVSAEDEDYVPVAEAEDDDDGADELSGAGAGAKSAQRIALLAKEVRARVALLDGAWLDLNDGQQPGEPGSLLVQPGTAKVRPTPSDARWHMTSLVDRSGMSLDARRRVRAAKRRARAEGASSSGAIDGFLAAPHAGATLTALTAATRSGVAAMDDFTARRLGLEGGAWAGSRPPPGPGRAACPATARFLSAARQATDTTAEQPSAASGGATQAAASRERPRKRLRRVGPAAAAAAAAVAEQALLGVLRLEPESLSHAVTFADAEAGAGTAAASGLDAAAAELEGARKKTTLEASSAEWEAKKSKEGFRDDVERFAKDGFVARQEFLEQAGGAQADAAKKLVDAARAERRRRSEREFDRRMGTG